MIRLMLTLACFAPALLLGRLSFETTAIDAQAAIGDKQYTGVFSFTNEGEEPVRIEKVVSSCGCTVPKLDKKIYDPGESGEILAMFEFGSRVGVQRKVITVVLGNERAEQIKLQLKVTIPEALKIAPRVLTWGPNEALGPKSIAVTVDPGMGGALRIADPAPGEFDLKLTAIEDKEGEYRLTVKPKVSDRRVRTRFTVELVDPDKEGKVIAAVPGFLLASPSSASATSAGTTR